MKKHYMWKRILILLCSIGLVMGTWTNEETNVHAVNFPTITASFDPTDESVIVEGVTDLTPGGPYLTCLEGYLNYDKERVETFCYGPPGKAYDIPEKEAYIFNWKDHEFVLPCSGEYTFTCYITVTYWDNVNFKEVKEKGPKTSIKIYLNKEDESTNWGPGLPNTTIETYDLEQIKGKDKTIEINEPEYSWNIKGTDIIEVPDANISLKIVTNPEPYSYGNVQEFFGMTLAYMLGIEHHGPFGFTATLRYNMGPDYVGKFAHLFYVVGDGTFVYMGSSLVEAEGYAIFPFDHASDYIIAVTDEPYTGQELNPKAEPEVEESDNGSEGGNAAEDSGTGANVEKPGDAESATSGNEAGEGSDASGSGNESAEGNDNLAGEDGNDGVVDGVGNDDTDVTNNSASGNDNGSSSIGIIGGADGPTAVFVAGNIGSVLPWVIGGIAVIGVIIALIIILKKKK